MPARAWGFESPRPHQHTSAFRTGPLASPTVVVVGPTAIVLLSCPDRPGIVAAVADFVARHGGNIVDADQHTDRNDSVFFLRMEFELNGFALKPDQLSEAFAPIADEFGMDVAVRFSDDRPRLAILASRAPHCLFDILARWRAGEVDADIAGVVSNHPDHAELCGFFQVPFRHLPVGDAHDQAHQERELRRFLAEERVDLMVLARYMRILEAETVAMLPNRIINIHHSFLPAFVGASPYRQAHERGVKVIGATAHYVTADLDQGPIIDQDVIRVSHRDGVDELAHKGRDLEVVVLARALRAHLDHRVLPWGNRTLVFD